MKFLYDSFLIFKRKWMHYCRWKLHFVFDVVVPLLDLVIFITLWSLIVKGGFKQAGMLTSENYVAYFLSGFVLWNFVRACFSWDFVHAFVREKYDRTIQYLLISPLNEIAIPYGESLLLLLRSTYSTLILLAVGCFFFNFSIQGSIFIALLLIFLTFLGFSGIGLIIAGLAAWREDFADIAWLVNWILSIASGVYFPVEALPTRIKNILMLLPSSQAVNAIRLVVLEKVGLYQLLPTIANLLIFAVVSLGIAFALFKIVRRKVMMIGI